MIVHIFAIGGEISSSVYGIRTWHRSAREISFPMASVKLLIGKGLFDVRRASFFKIGAHGRLRLQHWIAADVSEKWNKTAWDETAVVGIQCKIVEETGGGVGLELEPIAGVSEAGACWRNPEYSEGRCGIWWRR